MLFRLLHQLFTVKGNVQKEGLWEGAQVNVLGKHFV